MKWCGEIKPDQKRETGLWEITGLVSLDSKGGTNEIRIDVDSMEEDDKRM